MNNNKLLSKDRYSRVMSRVNSDSRTSINSQTVVTRHKSPFSKPPGISSVSTYTSSVANQLPTHLNGYEPEKSPPKRSNVAKPRKTVKSLDPDLAPGVVEVARKSIPVNNIRARCSAPTVINRNAPPWFDYHVKQCHSSRSHSKLKKLKDEINSFRDIDKEMHFKANLYKKSGIVLDDFGEVCVNKAVQADTRDIQLDSRSKQLLIGDDVRAPVPDEQMRVALPRYPVDRYLTVNDKSFDMVNIIGEDLWKAEPALKPEDEIILKKLQDMLHSITEDLQNTSKELSTNNEPGYRIKTQPLPQDEAFNTQVHVEEVVDAKFFGQKLIDKSTRSPIKKIDNDKNIKLVNKPKNQKTNTTVKVNAENRKKLTLSQTQVICIESNDKEQKLTKQIKNPRSSCTEFHFTHVPKETEKKHQLDVQHMPSINIRSELKEQNVLHLDISPKEETCQDVVNKNNNIAVVQIEHHENVTIPTARRLCRKFSKLSTYESSESTTQSKSSQLAVKQKNKDINKNKKKNTTRPAFRNELKNERQTEQPFDSNIANWRRKLNLVYASKSRPQSSYRKPSELKTTKLKQKNNSVQLSDYIPYSKLTLGGVNLHDIENEAPSSSLKDDLPLAPIIDKILSSRENSPRKSSKGGGILSISDENLLKEVLGLETEVTKTLTKVKVQSMQKKQKDITNPVSVKEPNTQKTENSEKSCDSYEDDFEDEKSNSETEDSNRNINESQQIKNTSSRESINKDEINETLDKTNEDNLEINENDAKAQLPQQNIPYVKTTNLSFKNSIDIFEYVHSVPMQDTETQSHVTNKFTLKEAQTSPRSDLSEPLNENKIESTLDPGNEVANVLQKEKDFIKTLILEEYGDLIKQNLSKPSGSNEKRHDFDRKNISAYQKNTQTSPARAKSVMTSPKRTKTRPTSPIQLNITVDKQTSAKVSKISSISDDSESEKLDITINLSSPRFSLRLPSTSGEVLSNLELFGHSRRSKKDSSLNLIALNKREIRRTNRKSISSSTSFEASSSEISSVGEVTFKFKRRMRKNRLEDLSETSIFSNSSSESLSGDIIPLRSEGEIIPRQQRPGRPNNMRQL